MQSTPNAIILGAVIVGACILAPFGYTVLNDVEAADAAQQGQRRQAERRQKVQNKEAWKTALKHMDMEFRKWLGAQVSASPNRYISVPDAWTKAFDLADIHWVDSRRVVVSGVIGATLGKGHEQYFSWTRMVELRSDGVDNWMHADDPKFGYLEKVDDTMGTIAIIMPGVELPIVE